MADKLKSKTAANLRRLYEPLLNPFSDDAITFATDLYRERDAFSMFFEIDKMPNMTSEEFFEKFGRFYTKALPTKRFTGELYIHKRHWRDNKNHRTPMEEVVRPKLVDVYNDIRDAYFVVQDYRAVYAGLNCYRRDVIGLDIDRKFTHEELEDILGICKMYDIPYPQVCIINSQPNKNGVIKWHFQIHWYLSKPYWKVGGDFSKQYKDTLRCIAELFNGDKNFKNGWLKNSECKKDLYQLDIWSDGSVSYRESDTNGNSLTVDPYKLYTSLCSAIYQTYGMGIDEVWALYKDVKTEDTSEDLSEEVEEEDTLIEPDTDSRHLFSFSENKKFIFNYISKKGCLPSLEETEENVRKLQWAVANKVGKKGIEPESEISKIAKSNLEFCKTHFNSSFKRGAAENYKYGNELHTVKSCIRAILAKHISKTEKKTSKIIKKYKDVMSYYGFDTKISDQSIRNFLKKSDDDVRIPVGIFYSEHRFDKGEETKLVLDMIDKILKVVGLELKERQLKLYTEELFDKYADFYKTPGNSLTPTQYLKEYYVA